MCHKLTWIACEFRRPGLGAAAVEVLGQSGRRGPATARSLSGTQTCSGVGNWTLKIADTPSRPNDLWRVGSRKLFHLKLPAAAALALYSGHRASRRGPATSPRTRPT